MSNNYQGQGNRPQRKLTLLDDFRMRLVGNRIDDSSERPPGWSVKVIKNRPVIEVKTNVASDQAKQYGTIKAELDPLTFEEFCNTLERIAAGGQDKAVIQCHDYPYTAQGRSKELKLQSSIIVGKEQDGTVYVGLVSWDNSRPVIKFPVRPSQYNRYLKSDGSRVDEAEMSQRTAASYARMIRQLVYQVLVNEYVPAERPQGQQNNNQQGGGQRNQGGYGGQQGGGGGYNNNGGNAGGGGGGDNWGSADSLPF